jgi:predicted ATP-grasp superfamily ATP-dependent carboligase
MPQSPLAIVLGDSNLLKALVRERIPCAIAVPPRAPLRLSRHARHVVTWRDDGPLEQQAARVLALAASEVAPPVVFYQSDAQLLWVSRNRRAIGRVARFAIADGALVDQLVDKTEFVLLAEARGLPVPPSVMLSATDDYAPPRDAPFPAVIKPVTRTIDAQWRFMAGDEKVLTVASPAALDAARARLGVYGKPVILQAEIPGPESQIVSYHLYVDQAGSVVTEFTGRKIRTLPIRRGITTSAEVLPLPDVLALGRKVVDQIGLTGVAKLDFKRSPDGRLFLLEVNPRFTLWNNPGAVAGFNIPAAVYADLVGLPRPPFRQGPYRVRWFNHQDLAAARESGMGLLAWLAWLLRHRPTSGLSLDDPLPIMELVWQLLRRP